MTEEAAVAALLDELVAALAVPGLSAELTTDPVRRAEIVDILAEIAAAPARRIDWIAINSRRVDATVTAAHREWRIVCSVDGDGVHAASAFERPARFEGVAGGRAVIVTGPSSVGKSSVMQALTDAASTPWVMFDELAFGRVPSPYLIWPDQSPTLAAGFVAGIAALALAGNQVVLTGEGAPGGPDAFGPLVAAVPTLVAGLECPLPVRIARQRARGDRWGGLTEEADETRAPWPVDVRFDTSSMAAAEIAQAILDRIGDHRDPGPGVGRTS